MKRREFIAAAAGIGAGGMLAGIQTRARAEDTPPEKALQIYKCGMCGALVEILIPGMPSLAHCGAPMTLLVEKTADAGREKHVPVIEKVDGGYRVKVGSVPHPMIESHYIMGIELRGDGKVYIQALHPGDKPEAFFPVDAKEVSARIYCNLHGLWKSV